MVPQLKSRNLSSTSLMETEDPLLSLAMRAAIKAKNQQEEDEKSRLLSHRKSGANMKQLSS